MDLAPTFQLVACDIDGTLVEPGNQVDQRTKEAVAAVRAAGIHFVLATGRQVRSASRYTDALGIDDMPLVCYQGSVVAYPHTPPATWLTHTQLDLDVALDVIERYGDANPINAYFDDHVSTARHTEASDMYERISGQPLRIEPDLATAVRANGTTKLILFVKDAAAREVLLEDLEARYAGRAWITASLPQFVEVCAHGISKATGLARVCEELGVDPALTIAVGDNLNDVEMIEWAGLGVAIRTGTHDAADVADLVIDGPDQQGLAGLLERIAAGDLRPEPATA